MTKAWCIEGARVLHAGQWSLEPVALEGDLVSERSSGMARTFDGRGLVLLPGIVDLHGDAFERQIMPRPHVEIPLDIALQDNDRQLIANGITTAFYGVSLSYEPGLRAADQTIRLARAIGDAASSLDADSRVHLRYEMRAMAQRSTLRELVERGQVQLLSFTDHVSLQQAELRAPGKRETYFARSGLDPVAFRAMLDELAARGDGEIDAHVRDLGARASKRGIVSMIHDPAHPLEIDRFAELGCTIAEFPLSEPVARRAREKGMPVVMGCPNVLRGGSHKGLVGAQDLLAKGLVSILVSDYHYPSMLAAIERLAAGTEDGLAAAWPLVSEVPARAAGLDDRGRIEPGLRADLILVELEPRARVRAVFVAGRLVFLDDAARI